MARAIAALAEQSVLCLPPATGELPADGGVIVSSPATPYRKQIEHAGHVYQQTLIRTYALNPEHAEPCPTDDVKAEKEPFSRMDSSDAAKKLVSKLAVGSDDLYELLELGDKRWHATADDIKKSFRRISLIYHPDKISHLGEDARKNSEAHFKAVMKAYDVLSDKKKRAAYDSIDDVDDSIPSEKDATSSSKRFYEKFGACFALNARWSVSNRVPELGDDDTSLESVDRFYDFWYSFKSWRDFSFDLEYDTDQAECREEKRWMERQNAKHVKVKKLEENTRIRKLVDLAYKHDPRLVRQRQAEKARKNAIKEERRRKVEETARAAKEKEEQVKRDAEQRAADEKVKRAAAKKQKDAARQIMRRARQKLRAVGRELKLMDSNHGLIAVESMCAEGTVEGIEAVTRQLAELEQASQGVEGTAISILNTALGRQEAPVAESQPDERSSKPEDIPVVSKSADPVQSVSNGESLPTENGQVAIPNGHAHDKKVSETHWTPEELSLLSKGAAKFPGGTRDRWERLAEYIGTKNADEVLQKVSESRPSKIKPNAVKVAPKSSDDANAFERFREKKKGKPVAAQGQTGSPVSAASVAQPPNKLQFTPKQQQTFEAALKRHPMSLGEARWKKVADSVGRSPEQCKERFMELIQYYKSRKSAKK